MGTLRLMLEVLAVCVFCCRAAPVAESLLVGGSPVSVQLGHTATLSCWNSPPKSAELLEVRWFLPDHFDSPVLLYQLNHTSQDATYAGRASFGLRDAASSGLRGGDVSLKLENVTLQDAGEYICYTSSDKHYNRATVSLVVKETGTPPLLSATWGPDGRLNLSCMSEGWFPLPSLHWEDPLQALTPQSLQYSTAPSGLVSVHSWILLPASTRVSCLVEKQEVQLEMQEPPAPPEGSGGAAGWVAFGLLLFSGLLAAAFLFHRKRGKKAKLPVEENQTLLPKDKFEPTQPSTACKSYVNVTLDKKGTEHEFLFIKDNILRDKLDCTFPDGAQVTCLTAITGTPSLSSGRHYWEVSLGNKGVGLKQSWWVGVTSKASIPGDSRLIPSSSDGFWFLSSSPNSLQLSTQHPVLLPPSGPMTLGVFLDFERGELSFYNVEEQSLICSLNADFTGPLYPLFNPGMRDKSPMALLQKGNEAER
ncbi:hypothetical protein PBY51_006025 [Eleginops maclovinus]|uniref:Uncharacterized protein n=1 Tax=Eleginops maclovinus TaxID=56733 RepID=A0AAN8AAU7_ELEMC|nr:hypothetical protein PBY51_006025 [Eleginops maclovinus]